MFFKKLEAVGFKSFALKTAVEFLPGVTVVVGPNGCGKSNILDAIRWVLGEQSAKSLRGGRMGDVIFNGSSSLKALGYAQISVTLSNEQRILPLDQSEIQITRRLFRTGESEYQLNKVNCRLKDITELFLDTGAGTNAYSIMEQGRVDQIINAKPHERREIFEEAAGISKYKMRRDEALRKLSRTQDDLVRIRDIIIEVERSCNSLKRQAQKAARYRRLKERERDLEQRLLVRRAEQLQGDHKHLAAEYRTAEDHFHGLNAQLARLEAAQTERQEEHQELQKTYQQSQSLLFALRTELERATHDRDMARERLDTARKRLDEIARELASAQDRATVLTATLAALGREAQSHESALQQKREELARETKHYEELRRSTDSLHLAAGQLRTAVAALTQRRGEVENDERLAQRLIEKIQAEMETQAAEVAQRTREAEELTAEVERRAGRIAAIETRLKALEAEHQALEAEIAQQKAERNDLQTRLEELTRRHHEIRSRLAALRELEESYEGYFRGVKEVMTASQTGRLKGIIGVVSALIGVRKEHETAIEVALGSQVQDIVTVGVDEAKAAIEYLKKGNLGRATFLPLNFLEAELREDSLKGVIERPGVVGFARKLVTYEPRLETVVRYLLGTTVVVDELDVAIGLKRDGFRTRFVTLGGDLVHPQGVLTGGSHQSRGLLSRVREIRRLEVDFAAIEQESATMRAQLQATSDRLNVAHASAAELQQKIYETRIERNTAQKDLESATATLRDRRAQLAQAEARQAQQRAECGRHQDTLQRCAEAAGQLAGQLEGKQSELAELENSIRKQLETVETLGQSVAERRIEVSTLNERLTGLRDKILSLDSDLDRAREDLSGKTEEKSDLEEDLDVQSRRMSESETRIVELTRQVEEAEKKTSLHHQTLETQENDLKRLGAEIQELLRDRNAADNEVREMQLRLTEIKTQLNYLEQEASEKFNLEIQQIKQEITARECAGRIEAALPVAEDEAASETGESSETEAEAAEEKTAARSDSEEDDLTDPATLRRLLGETREKIVRLGSVNTTAIEEYEEKRQRLDYLTAQEKDLTEAKQSLESTIQSLDQTCTELFAETFEKVRCHFVETFRRLFNGGRADLVLQEPEPGSDHLEAGIEILAQPPGKKLGTMTLLSGGEKALTAVSLMFALFLHKPSPFCVLDEIDAPLDDTNVGRFCDMLRDFSKSTQFIIITHNKITMSLADSIYGVTMQEPGVSKLVSVKFEEAVADRLLSGQAAG
jgi:chromosome segregation protein